MTTIDPHQRLAALQSQLAALRDRARVRSEPAAQTGAAHQQPVPVAGSAMAQRLQAIADYDPERRQKAVRVYLESELVREFGDGLLNDPVFPRMVEAVQQQMQADAPTAAAVQALGDVLLAGRRP
jgi:hypothetical protein